MNVFFVSQIWQYCHFYQVEHIGKYYFIYSNSLDSIQSCGPRFSLLDQLDSIVIMSYQILEASNH